ncbi:hypothetical protein OQA88_5349 [Cercophora sp. LCS_1]
MSYSSPRLLFAKHGRLATVHFDYIYGAHELLEPHFRHVFVPDYGPNPREVSQSLADLFAKLAVWLLLVDGWGDMLWYFPFRLTENYKGLLVLSWAPDFSRRPGYLHDEKSGTSTLLSVTEPEPPKYLSDDPKSVKCAIVDRMLHIDGCYLDVVQKVIPIFVSSG